MTTSIPDDVIWPTTTLKPDEFDTIAAVLSAEASPCWRFVIEPSTSHKELLIGEHGDVFGAFVGGVAVSLTQVEPLKPMGSPYLPTDAFVIHEVLTAWYAGPTDNAKMQILFDDGHGVKLRRGEEWLNPIRA